MSHQDCRNVYRVNDSPGKRICHDFGGWQDVNLKDFGWLRPSLAGWACVLAEKNMPALGAAMGFR